MTWLSVCSGVSSELIDVPTILVIGRNSFFAGRFVSASADRGIRHVSFDDLDNPAVYDGVGTVVNFSFDPRLYRETYDAALDVDRAIAEKISERALRYVLLSSRAVYGADAKWNAREDAETVGESIYGMNRISIERAVAARLDPARLTVLRVSNTIAYELRPGRRETFMSTLLGTLRERGEIHFEMSPQTRRDFITDDYFCRVLRRLIEVEAQGIFNVGCGYPVATGDIARWVIEGFGDGRLVVDSDEVRDEFFLNTNRLQERIGICPPAEALRDRCREIGRKLAGA
jgi:nucleoside-diphosphate-sugar epimerase